MNLRNIIISLLYLPFFLFNAILRFLRIEDAKVRILLMHDIPNNKHDNFASIIRHVSKRWNFISPEELEGHLSGAQSLKGRNVLLTFDDGFHSNRVIADEILDPLGIKALFFIPTGFVDMRGSRALQFAKTRLFPFSSPQDLSDGAYDAMSWEDIASLVHSGHCIGSHTDTHPELSSLTYQEQYHEIVHSADILSAKLSIPIQQFAYPFGSIRQVNKDSVKIAQTRFDTSYSNIRGMLDEQVASNFLFRQNIVRNLLKNSKVRNEFCQGTLDFQRYCKKK